MSDVRSDFISLDEIAKTLTETVEKALSSRSIIDSTFSANKLTECPRRLIYRSQYQGQLSSGCFRDIGHQIAIKKKWVSYLDSCKDVKMIKKDIAVCDVKLNIKGNIDCVLEFKDQKFIVNIYGVNHGKFQKIKDKKSLKKDMVAMMACMWMSEIKDGLLIYEDNDNQDYVFYHVSYYRPIVNSIQEKFSRLIMNSITGEIPNRSYEDKKSEECCECEFNKKCWG